jgi:hypothetical protein
LYRENIQRVKMLRGLVPLVRRVRFLKHRCFGALTDKPPAFASPAAQDASPQELALEKIKFEELFNASACKEIHDVREGGYVDLDSKDINTFIPEGLAGELEEEFDFSGRTSWMVRDAGKLLCRLIEDFEATKGCKGDGAAAVQPRGFSSQIRLSGLTDRPEWTDAKLQLFRYGKEVKPHHNSADTGSNSGSELVVVRGDGSFVEGLLSSVKTSNNQKLPTKIVLTGTC